MSEPIMYGGNPDYVLGLQKHNGRLARRIKELEGAIRRHKETTLFSEARSADWTLWDALPEEDDR